MCVRQGALRAKTLISLSLSLSLPFSLSRERERFASVEKPHQHSASRPRRRPRSRRASAARWRLLWRRPRRSPRPAPCGAARAAAALRAKSRGPTDVHFRSLLITQSFQGPDSNDREFKRLHTRVRWLFRTLSIAQSPRPVSTTLSNTNRILNRGLSLDVVEREELGQRDRAPRRRVEVKAQSERALGRREAKREHAALRRRRAEVLLSFVLVANLGGVIRELLAEGAPEARVRGTGPPVGQNREDLSPTSLSRSRVSPQSLRDPCWEIRKSRDSLPKFARRSSALSLSLSRARSSQQRPERPVQHPLCALIKK